MFSFIPDRAPAFFGGLDVGGTKIEATLFDGSLTPIVSRRVSTPNHCYDALIDALKTEFSWLASQAGRASIPVGVGIPGLVDHENGLSLTANLPAVGKPFVQDISSLSDDLVSVANDCRCFALSEAIGGAGDGLETVFGLILGTGLGGGVVVNNRLSKGRNLVAGEVGHSALPSLVVMRHNLPVLSCDCGRSGCYETYLSGNGMARLHQAMTNQFQSAPDIVSKAEQGDTVAGHVLSVWKDLAGELLHSIQLFVDPDCIVIGGGLSNVPGLEKHLSDALKSASLSGLRQPSILKPRFGDSSGTRGAALLVKTQLMDTIQT